jgi:protein-disulfide isomerase
LKGGKNRKEEFFKIHAVNTESEVVTNEFERHLAWIDKTGLRATPTILVNSYKLPDNYKIEDLKYL